MSVSLLGGNQAQRTGTNNPFSWIDAADGFVPNGVIIFALNNTSATDHITGITYGGVSLTKIITAADTAGEPFHQSAWFLGSGVPTGVQTVEVTFSSATTDDYWFVSNILESTTGADLTIQDSSSLSENQANPQVTLIYGGYECQAFCAIGSGLGAPANLALLTGMSAGDTIDFGNDCARA